MKDSLKKIEERLRQEKLSAEAELSKFAKKDEEVTGGWDTRFPELTGGTGGEILEDLAKKREEYENLLPVEFVLEKKLQNIESALQKIKKGQYGICEKCGKKILKERLLAIPEAKFCMKCQE